jgi:polyisoprenoid-binding protein YceI
MKTKLLFLCCFALSLFSDVLGQNLAESVFSYKSCYLQYIKIEGETNVSDFTLSFDNSRANNIEVAEKINSDNSRRSFIEFKIPVQSFKGANPLIENDFRDLLDASNHPEIIVEIERRILEYINHSRNSAINFSLTIAGKTQGIRGEYITKLRDESIILSGNAEIRLSDFSISPPQKMFGMLQVKDIIIIKFDILILGSNS